MTRLSYDEVGEAFAIVLRDAPAVETIELADGVLLDVGEDGDPVGMEFVSLSQLAPFLIARRSVRPARATIDRTHGYAQVRLMCSVRAAQPSRSNHHASLGARSAARPGWLDAGAR